MAFVLTCRDCDQDFEFSEGELKWFEAHELVPPKRCKKCRAQRKQKLAEAAPEAIDESGRPAWAIVCSICNSPALVPFRPTPTWPTFCRDCYQKGR